jgi:hypothetical protein
MELLLLKICDSAFAARATLLAKKTHSKLHIHSRRATHMACSQYKNYFKWDLMLLRELRTLVALIFIITATT